MCNMFEYAATSQGNIRKYRKAKQCQGGIFDKLYEYIFVQKII